MEGGTRREVRPRFAEYRYPLNRCGFKGNPTRKTHQEQTNNSPFCSLQTQYTMLFWCLFLGGGPIFSPNKTQGFEEKRKKEQKAARSLDLTSKLRSCAPVQGRRLWGNLTRHWGKPREGSGAKPHGFCFFYFFLLLFFFFFISFFARPLVSSWACFFPLVLVGIQITCAGTAPQKQGVMNLGSRLCTNKG